MLVRSLDAFKTDVWPVAIQAYIALPDYLRVKWYLAKTAKGFWNG